MNCVRHEGGPIINRSLHSRTWLLLYVGSFVAGAAASAVAAVQFTNLSPLATHRVVVPLNSAATSSPTPLEGFAELPQLFAAKSTSQQWAIIGGTLLQMGLSRLSIPVLERAVAADKENMTLRVALGEALALANGETITDAAKSEFEIALRADPNDLIARFYIAHWLLQNGKAKPALVKLVGLMRTVGSDQVWYDRLWSVMPRAADEVGISRLTLEALCVAGM